MLLAASFNTTLHNTNPVQTTITAPKTTSTFGIRNVSRNVSAGKHEQCSSDVC